jgi:hypothetical protein
MTREVIIPPLTKSSRAGALPIWTSKGNHFDTHAALVERYNLRMALKRM